MLKRLLPLLVVSLLLLMASGCATVPRLPLANPASPAEQRLAITSL